MTKKSPKKYRYSLVEFRKQYRTDRDCFKRLAQLRWPNGFVCPKCGCIHGCLLSNGHYECYDCGHQTSVTAGTIMHKTHLPLTKWFLAFYLVTQDKRGISALQLAKQLSVTYKTAWYLLKRIRSAMRQRDDQHMLTGVVEFDDMFIGAPTKGKGRGRSTQKARVLVALSLDENGKPQYLKMQVTPDFKRATIKNFTFKNIQSGSTIKSDGCTTYGPVLSTNYNHQPQTFKQNKHHLHWLHIAISNAKAFVLGTFHGLDKKCLQMYLDEYCYRFSRRYFGADLLERLALAVATSVP